MKQLLRLLAVALCVMGCLLTAGCGEDEAYNKLKNEYVAMYKDWDKKCEAMSSGPTKKSTDERETFLKETSTEMQKKLDEMKKIASKDTNLNNDYLKLQKEFDESVENRYAGIREVKAIEKMRKESSGLKPALVDPIGDYYKKKGMPIAPR